MMRTVLVVAAALAALVAGVWAQHSLGDAPKVEARPVDLSIAFPDLKGRKHPMDEWKGKVLVINFWATWCPPCLEEMPEFVKLQQEFGERGLQFVGIAIDDADSVKEYLLKMPVNYPILIGENGGDTWAFKLGNKVNVLPFTAVFSRTGQLIHVEQGPFKRKSLLKVVGSELGLAK
jgi:thiol-disulfide isomerase/thioredoxin